MGMSASQARFLCLTARKTNTEYEGQQINQQRLALSNESSNYYSQLASMTVPTPPSSSDYNRITYTFVNGTELSTITSMVATENTKSTGVYKLNYTQQFPSDTMVCSGSSQVTLKLNADGSVPTGNKEYTIGAIELKQAYTEDDINDLEPDDIKEHLIAAGIPQNLVNQMTPDTLIAKAKVEARYNSMMVEKYGTGAEGDDTTFKVIYRQKEEDGSYEPVFFKDDELKNIDYNQKTGMSLGGIKTYEFGQSTQTREIKNADARLEQDSSGRFISIYIYDDYVEGQGVQQPGTKYDLTTSTEADERAYNDAMNQYFYDKAVYDAKVQEINAKIEIIQTQDKNLELKLKQLDTEQNAISTELDAVKKVITKNVESSFKTFNA